jgi:hypothetical protein
MQPILGPEPAARRNQANQANQETKESQEKQESPPPWFSLVSWFAWFAWSAKAQAVKISDFIVPTCPVGYGNISRSPYCDATRLDAIFAANGEAVLAEVRAAQVSTTILLGNEIYHLCGGIWHYTTFNQLMRSKQAEPPRMQFCSFRRRPKSAWSKSSRIIIRDLQPDSTVDAWLSSDGPDDGAWVCHTIKKNNDDVRQCTL